MERQEFEARYVHAIDRAKGRWTEILIAIGVPERILNRRNQPCPIRGCGGTDRFQYTDKFGHGNYHCRSCGPGGGFKLAMAVTGCGAGETLEKIEDWLACLPHSPPEHPARRESREKSRALVLRLWGEASPVAGGDDVDHYLTNRGLHLSVYPETLRCHPSLGYYEKESRSGKSVRIASYPAMLALVQDSQGNAVTLHRTYLESGRQVPGIEAKKLLSGGINGAAVRLVAAGEHLGVCEGIENALAVFRSTGLSMWAGISAGNLERLWIPDSVTRIRIYGDNDANAAFDGQASAYILARRLMKSSAGGRKREVEVFIPRHAGADWADVWLASPKHAARAA